MELSTLMDYNGIKKSELKSMAEHAVLSVLENGNPLEVAESLSAMEEFIKNVRADKRFTEYVREEAGKHGKQYTSTSGAKIELAETGTKYDFEVCCDTEHDLLESQLNGITEQLKKRKDFLKTVPAEGLTVVNPLSGEVETIYPPSKTSTSSYKITLAK